MTFVNGTIITEDYSTTKNFNETKTESVIGVRKIFIRSENTNIRISSTNSANITAHLYGRIVTNKNLFLKMQKIDDEIHISVETINSIVGNNPYDSFTIINTSDSFCIQPLVNIQIPESFTSNISIESKNANIDIATPIAFNQIDITSICGKVSLATPFKQLNINCQNGSINVNTHAKCNMQFNILSRNGNINVNLSNIYFADVDVSSNNGISKNTPKLFGDYRVKGSINSANGDAIFA